MGNDEQRRLLWRGKSHSIFSDSESLTCLPDEFHEWYWGGRSLRKETCHPEASRYEIKLEIKLPGGSLTVPILENDPNNVSVEYVEVLQACWDNDPTKRPSFQEVARKLEALKRKMVRPNPNNIPQRFAAKSVTSTQRPPMRILQTRESVSVAQGRTESGVQALLQKFQTTPSPK